MLEFLTTHAHQVFMTTRKMYGSIPSFCWYAYFIWLGVQALEMEENSGSLSTKMADFLPSSTLWLFISLVTHGKIHTSTQVA
jgi:hypothetical protein